MKMNTIANYNFSSDGHTYLQNNFHTLLPSVNVHVLMTKRNVITPWLF